MGWLVKGYLFVEKGNVKTYKRGMTMKRKEKVGKGMQCKRFKLNIHELRGILSDEIMSLREGKTTPANVNAITNATGKILQSVRMEMEYSKLLGKVPDIDFVNSNVLPTNETKNKIGP